MRILVVNPNTTASMTEAIGEAARSVASAGTEIEALNPAMGPASIEGFYDEAFAVPGLLAEIVAGASRGADAAVIACFDDTGLDAARTAVSIPVLGICEAALAAAGMVATKISVVSTLPRSIVPLEHLVRKYGFADRARVHAADIPVLGLEDAGAGARLREAIRAAIEADRSDAVVLGCAGMASLAQALSAELGVPVVDGVSAAVRFAEALAGLGLKTSKAGAYAAPLAKPYTGLLAGFAPGAVRPLAAG
jgi:allantoin racemase